MHLAEQKLLVSMRKYLDRTMHQNNTSIEVILGLEDEWRKVRNEKNFTEVNAHKVFEGKMSLYMIGEAAKIGTEIEKETGTGIEREREKGRGRGNEKERGKEKEKKKERDGNMMKLVITERTEVKKGMTKLENVEDPNMAMTGRGRIEAGKESKKNPDIDDERVNFKGRKRGWTRKGMMIVLVMETERKMLGLMIEIWKGVEDGKN